MQACSQMKLLSHPVPFPSSEENVRNIYGLDSLVSFGIPPPRRYPEPSIGFHRNGRLIAIHLIQLIEIAVSDTGVILAGVPTGDVIPILISTLTVDCHVACVFLSLSTLTSLTARKQSRFHRLPARKTGPFSRYNPYIARHPHRVSPRSSTEKAPDLRRHI